MILKLRNACNKVFLLCYMIQGDIRCNKFDIFKQKRLHSIYNVVEREVIINVRKEN